MTRARQTVTHLPVQQLLEHPGNVRDGLGDLSELTASIHEHGILQPLVVTEHPETDERHIVLAGHRRLAAAMKAGLTRVPVVVRHGITDESEQLVVMIVENCQRRDLSPMEKAEAYGALRNHGLTIAEISRRTGVNQTTISTLLNLLELDSTSQEDVRAGRLNSGDAIEAVREARQADRLTQARPTRGRPVHAEPPHFTGGHPLFALAASICAHTTRPKVQGSLVCGQCWEVAVRADALGEPMPEPMYDEMIVQRVLDGATGFHVMAPDRVEIVRRWLASGKPLADLEQRHGWKVRQYVLPESSAQDGAA